MEYIWIGWLAFIVIAVIAEAASAALISVWFIPGAIVALILSLFGVPLWVQFVIFAVISVLLLVFTRKFVKRFLKGKGERTNADAVIGQKAVVTERVCNIEETGAVKVMGKEWSARSVGGETYEVGDVVTVKEISGVKLICNKE